MKYYLLFHLLMVVVLVIRKDELDENSIASLLPCLWDATSVTAMTL